MTSIAAKTNSTVTATEIPAISCEKHSFISHAPIKNEAIKLIDVLMPFHPVQANEIKSVLNRSDLQAVRIKRNKLHSRLPINIPKNPLVFALLIRLASALINFFSFSTMESCLVFAFSAALILSAYSFSEADLRAIADSCSAFALA